MSEDNYFLKPNKQRANQAIILLLAVLLINLIQVFIGYLEQDLINKMADGEYMSVDIITTYDRRSQIAEIINIFIYGISIITFIRWFRRAYYNLHQFRIPLTYTEDWAAGSWFVPLLNWLRPYVIMMELYNETIKLLTNIVKDIPHKYSTKYIPVWWISWIIVDLSAIIIYRIVLESNTTSELMDSTSLLLALDFANVLVCIPAIKIVKDYSEMETLLYQSQTTLNNYIAKK